MEQQRPGKLSLRAMEAFIAVVEEQSISLAARRLGISISAVSLQLSNLESVLDCRLVERTAQRFAVTEAGRLFQQRALRIIDEIDGARTDLITQSGSPHFDLRLAVVEDFDTHVMPRWLAALGRAFPNSRFVVKSGPSHENFSILSSRAADMIVAADAMEPVDWIEEHPLMRDPCVLVTGPDIAGSGDSGSSISVSGGSGAPSLETLMSYPFVRYARDQHLARQIEAQLRRVKSVPPRGHEFSSNHAVFAMVAETGGWAISTVSAIRGTLPSLESARAPLSVHKLPFPAFSRTISLYARKDILSAVPEMAAIELRTCLKDIFSARSTGFDLPARPQVFDGNAFKEI